MKLSGRVIAIFASLSLLALVVGVLLISPYQTQIQWRAQLVTLKLLGSFPLLSWEEIFPMLRPGQSYLKPELLFLTSNPYIAISNPHTSGADITSGAETFRSRCALCHTGNNTAPDLRTAEISHGSSDWALFRTISHGIAGTEMKGLTLTTL